VLRFIAYRLAAFIPTLLVASMVLFVAINVIPGSAASSSLGMVSTPDAKARFEHAKGLDRPLHIQYFDWLGSALQGDFGKSFQTGTPVGPEVADRIPVTLELAAMAFLIANLIAIPLGALAAYFHQRPMDGAISFFATVAGAVPNFWLATLLILAFSLSLGWVAPSGHVPFTKDPLGNLALMIMPALSLGIVSSALLLRIMRAAMIDVFGAAYVETAVAKGASPRVVIWRHAVRNALIPFLTVGGIEFSFLFGGVVIIEEIFLIPGMGSLVLVGILQRDYPTLLAAVLAITIVVLTVNLIVDILAALIDPRQIQARGRR